MGVIAFPGAPEPEPKPLTPTLPDPFAALDALGRSLIAACGDKTVREALTEVLDMPAKDVLAALVGNQEP